MAYVWDDQDILDDVPEPDERRTVILEDPEPEAPAKAPKLSILKNKYPCCNRSAYLSEQGTYGRRCKPCARSYNVTVAPSAVLPVDSYGVVLVASWEDRQYRRRG